MILRTKKPQAHNAKERPPLTAGWYTQKRRPVQNNAETRLQGLKNLVDALRAAEHPAWLANTARMCEAVDELRVKVEALDWMLRVAKHFNGPNLGILLSAIEKSLADLEKAVESEMRAYAIPSLGD